MRSEVQSHTTSTAAPTDYDLFAPIYNRWMAEDFCRRAWPVIHDIALRQLDAGARVLDLCCGTGHMARALTDSGFRVTGIDASDEMLRYARINAPGATFVRADARRFDLRTLNASAPFNLVLSTFNSLAHLDSISDLSDVFSNVRACLAPGAAFVFDLTMEDAYASKWHGSFALVTEDHACIIQPAYDQHTRTGTNRITVFEVQPRNESSQRLYSRSSFTITQKCHPQADLRAALNSAGFRHVDCLDAERDLHMDREAGRAFFVCR